MARSIYFFSDSEEFGGAERALLLLIERLDRTRWHPRLIHTVDEAQPLLTRARELDTEVERVGELPLGLRGARRVPRFARRLWHERPDVFHAHLSDPLAAKYALTAAVLARVPAVVATLHLFPDRPLDASNRLQLRLLGRWVDRYIAVSADIGQRLRRDLDLAASRVVVIRNGVALETLPRRTDARLRDELASDHDQPVVLAVGRLVPQKGHEVFLRAVAGLPGIRAVIVGDGPLRGQLERYRDELGLAERVAFLGERADVPELLAASDCFAHPSLFEGTSLAVIEAMAAEKPIVASAIPGTDELLVDGETALLVPPGDSEALRSALEHVLAEPDLARNLARAARSAAVRSHSASAAVERISLVYEQLLEESRRR